MSRTPRRVFSALLVFTLLMLGIDVVPLGAAGRAVRPVRAVRLNAVASGEGAIRALGSSITDVASAHGKSVAQLARALRSDHALAVDRGGRLFYRDDEGPAALGADTISGGATAEGAPYPLENTFALHSVPGSKRTLYLDFDGHVLSGTAWNSSYNGGANIVAPAWDIEGGPTLFTDAERARIQGIWQRVAEDYAPFDVDVTTELVSEDRITRSSNSDDVYGMRVLISPISSYVGSYGGVAYVGVFDNVGDYYKPALVFPEKLGNSEKSIAEAAAHEAGHTFGLLHDGTTAGEVYYAGHGTGDTGWAPIMGNGYYRNLTQWSRGEYPNANNTEDDFAVIQSNGGVYRADDHGDSMATATQLAAGTQLSASGLIGRTGDADMLTFSAGAGPVTFSAAPAAPAPNLDLLLELRDSSGALVASGNPVDYLNASVSAVVGGGTYYLSVKGTGKGDLASGYSNYGSLGAWTVTGTVVDPRTPLAPVATANATPASGESPLPVVFDGSASHDPDGSIASYVWDFGDGSSATGAMASHTYSAPGSYVAVLTVTDVTGLASTADVSVFVRAPNSLPTAAIFASPASGQTPLAVSLDGSGSNDPDGSIVSWRWDFGDGSSGSGVSASHTYISPGSYAVRLTVTDDRGGSGSSTALVQVNAVPVMIMRLTSIQLSVAATKLGKEATARVLVTDAFGKPVAGARVSGTWSGAVSGASAGTTDSKGTAVLRSKRFQSGTIVFTVKSISKTGCSYDPTRNVVTSVSNAAGQYITRYLR